MLQTPESDREQTPPRPVLQPATPAYSPSDDRTTDSGATGLHTVATCRTGQPRRAVVVPIRKARKRHTRCSAPRLLASLQVPAQHESVATALEHPKGRGAPESGSSRRSAIAGFSRLRATVGRLPRCRLRSWDRHRVLSNLGLGHVPRRSSVCRSYIPPFDNVAFQVQYVAFSRCRQNGITEIAVADFGRLAIQDCVPLSVINRHIQFFRAAEEASRQFLAAPDDVDLQIVLRPDVRFGHLAQKA